MTGVQRSAQGLMAIFGLLMIVFSSSVYADTGVGTFPDDAKALITTAGVCLGVLVITLATVGVSSGERWAWLALWVLPAFFLGHCVLIGTWVPDGVFLVLSIVALLLTRPRYDAGDRAPAVPAILGG